MIVFIIVATLAQVISWEFCEIFKNTFFMEHLQTPTSEAKVWSFIWKTNFVNFSEQLFLE